MTATATKRPVVALDLPDVAPAAITSIPPELKWVDPRKLSVDDVYQRDLTDRSIRLIRRIVAEWDWRAYKPPIVVENNNGFDVIDGQHTAIAAVTHGGIPQIPVFVVAASEQADRAQAFVRHNRDRIAVTSTQLHNSMVAAGDETALTIHQVCERAGVTILRNPPAQARFKPGETLAVSTIRGLISRRHAMGARKVLEICVQAGLAPCSAAAIRAVEHLLHAPEYKDQIQPETIIFTLSARMNELEREAERFAAERRMPYWRALASIIFMNRRGRRRD